jgi:diguanylate cyclase (GGDEF)-like protein
MDIDNFKPVNDQYGHQEGDRVLITIADVLSRRKRRGDVIARLGGDEFVTYLPATNEVGAMAYYHSLIDELQRALDYKKWGVTFSVGLATFYAQPASVNDVFSFADKLMYVAKHRGKNQFHQDVYR